MAQYLDDEEDVDPKLYIGGASDTKRTFKSYKNIEDVCKLKALLTQQTGGEKKKSSQRISLECRVFGYSNYPSKEQASSKRTSS